MNALNETMKEFKITPAGVALKAELVKHLKRATERLRQAGITDVVIVKRLWGYAPHNPGYSEQRSECFGSQDEAVQRVIEGFRPVNLREPQEVTK